MALFDKSVTQRDNGARRTEVRTPIGDYTRVSNNYYTGGDGQPWSMNWAGIDNGEAGLHAGTFGNPSAPTYFGDAFLPGYEQFGQYIPDFNKTINTPVGSLNFESNYDVPNSISAELTPNSQTQYYLNAIAKMLGM